MVPGKRLVGWRFPNITVLIFLLAHYSDEIENERRVFQQPLTPTSNEDRCGSEPAVGPSQDTQQREKEVETPAVPPPTPAPMISSKSMPQLAPNARVRCLLAACHRRTLTFCKTWVAWRFFCSFFEGGGGGRLVCVCSMFIAMTSFSENQPLPSAGGRRPESASG